MVRERGEVVREYQGPDPLDVSGTAHDEVLAHARHRQYLVSEVTPATRHGESTRVSMVCLDDDAQGRPLTIFWELELGARVDGT